MADWQGIKGLGGRHAYLPIFLRLSPASSWAARHRIAEIGLKSRFGWQKMRRITQEGATKPVSRAKVVVLARMPPMSLNIDSRSISEGVLNSV